MVSLELFVQDCADSSGSGAGDPGQTTLKTVSRSCPVRPLLAVKWTPSNSGVRGETHRCHPQDQHAFTSSQANPPLDQRFTSCWWTVPVPPWELRMGHLQMSYWRTAPVPPQGGKMCHLQMSCFWTAPVPWWESKMCHLQMSSQASLVTRFQPLLSNCYKRNLLLACAGLSGCVD